MTTNQNEKIKQRLEKALTERGFTYGLRSEVLAIESENEDDPDRVFIHASGEAEVVKAELWHQVNQGQEIISCDATVTGPALIALGLGLTGSGHASGHTIKTAREAIRMALKDLERKFNEGLRNENQH